jgi:uncharacterized repeat protein (TIGR01451 family)
MLFFFFIKAKNLTMRLFFNILFLLMAGNAWAQYSEPHFLHTYFSYQMESVAQGDLDGDGLPDLVFAFENNAQISWSKNLDGEGRWSTNLPIDMVTRHPRQVHITDLDGDGKMDVLAATTSTPGQNLVLWYRNEGSFQFSEPKVIDSVADDVSTVREISITYGDMDNDGDIDVAAAYEFIDKVVWYRNEGNGNFSGGLEISSIIEKPILIHFEHMNEDDFLDLVYSNDGGSIIVQENFNGLTFDVPKTIASPNSDIESISFADLDGDGDTDIAAGTFYSDEVIWFENYNNVGNFSVQKLLGADLNNVTSVVAVDIDGDNDNDIIFRTGFGEQLGVFRNLDGLGNFDDIEIISNDFEYTYTSTLIPFDKENDGDFDLIATGDSYKDYFIFSNTDGQGNYEIAERMNMSPPDLGDIFIMEDLDGDSFLDMIFTSEAPFRLGYMRYNPYFNFFENPRIIEETEEVRYLKSIDLNNDGANDLIYVPRYENLLVWRLNNGTGQFSDEYSLPLLGAGTGQPFFGDLNNDGWIDPVIAGDGLFWYPNGVNGLQSPVLISSTTPTQLNITDLDNDGHLDILPTYGLAEEVGWFRNNGSGFDDWTLLFDFPSFTNDIIVHDFNKDGLKDLMVYSNSFNDLFFFPADSVAVFSESFKIANNSNNVRDFHIMDYDLDGWDDIVYTEDLKDYLLWHRNTNDDNYFTESEEIEFESENYHIFIVEDLDADNDLDFVYGSWNTVVARYNIASNSSIIAKSFFDENNNGVFDLGERALNQFQFSLSPDSTIYLTSNDTSKHFFVREGTYILNALPQPGWHLTTGPSNIPITINSDTLIRHDFGYFPDSIFSRLNTDLTSGPTRCGFEAPFWLTVNNDGTQRENGLIELDIPDYVTFLSAEPSPDSIFDTKLYWKYDDLFPTHPFKVQLFYEIFGTGFLGTDIEGFVKVFDNNGDLVSDYFYNSVIACAYDPNDKMVKPEGYLEEHFSLFEEELEYLVRFQNTGTDTAFNVVIRDTLDVNLDWNSFRIISSSHYMETNIDYFNGNVEFFFPDILLPDSMVNEPLSHGFVKYAILPKMNLEEEQRIENTASIYFDFNPPIHTNTTWNTMVSQYPIYVNKDLTMPSCPGDSNGSIQLDVTAVTTDVIFEWSDPDLEGNFVENISAGTYEVTITDGTGGSIVETILLEDPPSLGAQIDSYPQTNTGLGIAGAFPQGGTPPYTVTWDIDPPQTGTVIYELEAGTYVFTVVDNNGCTFTDSVEVEFTTSLLNLNNFLNFEVYPNPNSGSFELTFPNNGIQKAQIEITDITGKLVYQENVNLSQKVFSIRLDKSIRAGTYFIHVRQGQLRGVRKLILVPND